MCVIFMGSFQYWPQSLPYGIEYDSEPRTLKCHLPLNSGVHQEVIVLALSVMLGVLSLAWVHILP